MPDVTITDAKEAREFLVGRIQVAVEHFEFETSLQVASIDLTHLQSASGKPTTPIVQVTVELP